MSTVGHIRTALQYYCMAQEPLAYALGHTMAGRPLNRSEVEDAEANLRRAADALRYALSGRGEVLPFPPPKPFVRAGAALPDYVGKIFDTDALINVPRVNGGDKPSGDAA